MGWGGETGPRKRYCRKGGAGLAAMVAAVLKDRHLRATGTTTFNHEHHLLSWTSVHRGLIQPLFTF